MLKGSVAPGPKSWAKGSTFCVEVVYFGSSFEMVMATTAGLAEATAPSTSDWSEKTDGSVVSASAMSESVSPLVAFCVVASVST